MLFVYMYVYISMYISNIIIIEYFTFFFMKTICQMSLCHIFLIPVLLSTYKLL